MSGPSLRSPVGQLSGRGHVSHQDDVAISAPRVHVLINEMSTTALLLTEARRNVDGHPPANDGLLAEALKKTTAAVRELQGLMQGAPGDLLDLEHLAGSDSPPT